MTDMKTETESQPRRPSVAGRIIAGGVYALVALGLRLIMARAFFLSGQAKIEGPGIPIHARPFDYPIDFTVTLPAAIKDSTFQIFEAPYSVLPIPSAVTVTVLTYAEFVLPICLALGFATRLAALILLAMTVLLQLYVMPGMWWAAHVYWIAILTVLITLGPGAISIDALIRWVHRRGG
jgi:putative oxidoreductase